MTSSCWLATHIQGLRHVILHYCSLSYAIVVVARHLVAVSDTSAYMLCMSDHAENWAIHCYSTLCDNGMQ